MTRPSLAIATLLLVVQPGMAAELGLCDKLLEADLGLRVAKLTSRDRDPGERALCSASDLQDFKRALDQRVLGRDDIRYEHSGSTAREFERWRSAICGDEPVPTDAIGSMVVFAGQSLLRELNRCLALSYEHRLGLRCSHRHDPVTDTTSVSVGWRAVDVKQQRTFSWGSGPPKLRSLDVWNGRIEPESKKLRPGRRLPLEKETLTIERVEPSRPVFVSIATHDGECHFYTPAQARYELTGRIWAVGNLTEPVTERFTHDARSKQCDANFVDEQEMCLEDDARVERWTEPEEISVNERCGSEVLPPRRDPDRPNCIIGVGRVRGCGYKEFPFKMRECLGRGGFSYSVTVFGTRFVEMRAEPFAFQSSSLDAKALEIRYPLANLPGDLRDQTWTFSSDFVVRQGAEIREIRLTPEVTTSPDEGIETMLSEQGVLTISRTQ